MPYDLTYVKCSKETNLELTDIKGRSGGWEKWVKWSQKAHISSYKISYRALMYSMVTMINNTVLHNWKYLGESILEVLILRRKSSMYDDLY